MKRASAPGYDRFKTVVAVILAIILLLMLLRGCATVGVPLAPSEVLPVASATNPPPASAPSTQTAPALTAIETASPTPLPPTVEVTATPTSAAATETPASAATEAPTGTPEQATPTQAATTSCNTVAASRLSVGQKAQVIQRLNVRSSASIKASILKVNPSGTQVEIIGGPTCEPVGDHAYLWWQVRLADGTDGWSAESPLNSSGYFLEPVP